MPHINEKIDFTVEAYIVHNNKVFLRKHEKYGIWLAPGGHIELDEDPIQALIREVKEETGLDVELIGTPPPIAYMDNWKRTELLAPAFMNRHRVSDTHEHISLTYLAISHSDKIIPTGDDISNEWRWVTEKELDDMDLLESVRYYARVALKAAKEHENL